MPESGASAAKSGNIYEHTVAVEFLIKMILQEDGIDCVQINAPEPIEDIVLYINQKPCVYIEVKEKALKGLWTASKLNREMFWHTAKRQLENNTSIEVWLVTSSAVDPALKELTERCRLSEDEKSFDRLIRNIIHLRRELIRISKSVELDENSTKEILKHVHYKDSFGSTEDIVHRVANRLERPQDKTLIKVLRDEVAAVATQRPKFTRHSVYSILEKHGLVLKLTKKKLITCNLEDLISLCYRYNENQILDTLGEKYIPDLFVTRQAQITIEKSLFKSQQRVAGFLRNLQSTITREKDIYTKLAYSKEHIEKAYVALDKKLQETIDRLQNAAKVDWDAVSPQIEKMISDLHSTEGTLMVERLRNAINNVTVVVDKAGRGKTNILCHLAIEWSKQNIVVLLTGSRLILTDEFSILRKVGEILGFETNLNPTEEWPRSLNDMLQNQQKYIVLIIDAINECPNTELLKTNLEALAKLTHSHNLRILISCRDIYWAGYFHARNDILDKYTALITALGDFTYEEFNEVWPKYCNYFHITVRNISRKAQLALHNPLLLRFFCEAYGNKFGPIRIVGPIIDIRLKKLFDDYWLNKSDSIKSKLQYRSAGEISRFLELIAYHMLNNMSRYVPLNEMPAITGELDMQTKKSKYVAVLDEDVIVEQSVFGYEQRVSFVYDEFMEYMMAYAVIRRLPHESFSKLVNKLDEMLSVSRKYPNILGVVGYSAIILKEEKQLSVWEHLLEKHPDWYLSATRSLVQLDEKNLDKSTLLAVRKITETACKSRDSTLCIELLDLLDRITALRPHESIAMWGIWLCNGPINSRPKASDTLEMLATSDHEPALLQLTNALTTGDESTATLAASALGKVPNKRVPRILIENASHKSPMVKRAIAYSLGLFDTGFDGREALLNLLCDPDFDVCYTAAISILQDDDDEVGQALKALGTTYAASGDGEMRYTGNLLKEMADLWEQLHFLDESENLRHLISDYESEEILEVLEVMKTLEEQLLTHPGDKKAALIDRLDYLIQRCQKLYSSNL